MKSGWYKKETIARRDEKRWVIGMLPDGDVLSLVIKSDGTGYLSKIAESELNEWTLVKRQHNVWPAGEESR